MKTKGDGVPTGGFGSSAERACRHFENTNCEYYPCHAILSVNCLFCFCPLYHLEDCGGNWKLTDKGVKDCGECVLPHVEGGYDFVIKRLT
jgi:Zn-finger protein